MNEACQECAELAKAGEFHGCAFMRKTGVFRVPRLPEYDICPIVSANYRKYPLPHPNGSIWTDRELGITK